MPTVLRRRFSRGITNTANHLGAYTVPAGATCAVKGLSVATRGGVGANVTVELRNSAGAVQATFIENAAVPPNDSLVVIGAEQTVFLEAGDRIYVTGSTGSTLDAIVHFAEIT